MTEPNLVTCRHCDNGFKGMDRCNKCGATGLRFKVGDQFFPNTMAGYNGAVTAISLNEQSGES